MGEIIKREVPKIPLEFTGERYTSANEGQTHIEHVHRALMARSICRGKDVLDIASGEGYGSALIAQVARSVIGVDISDQAVNHATAAYSRENLTFCQGSALSIPLDDASVDIVISFETIEHFTGHETFLAEIRRVLRPGGVAVISTPDIANYSPESEPPNPDHVHEMSRDEFSDLMNAFFPHVAYLAQRTLVGSALFFDEPLTGKRIEPPMLTYEARSVHAYERLKGLARAKYLVAFASDDPDALSVLEQSLFVATSEIDRAVQQAEPLRREIEALRAALRDRDALEDRWRQDIEKTRGWYESAKEQAHLLRETLSATERQLGEKQAVVAHLDAEKAAVTAALAAIEERHRQELNDAMARADTSAQHAAALQGAISNSESTAQMLQAKVARLEAELEGANAAAAEASARVRALSDALQASERRIAEKQAEAVAANAAKGAEVERLSSLLRTLEDRIGTKEQATAQLERVLAETTAECERLRGELEGALAMPSAGQQLTAADWRARATFLEQQGELRAAVRAWRSAVAADEGDALARAGLGNALVASGNHDEGLSALTQAFALSPSLSAVAQQLRSLGLSNEDLLNIALRAAATSPNTAPSIGYWLESAAQRTLFYMGRQPSRPRASARRLLKLAAQSSSATQALVFADASARLVGLDGAIGGYARALALAPEDAGVQRSAVDLRYGNFGFAVEAKEGLRRVGDGSWLSLSEDPQFHLNPEGQALPAGWTLITIRAESFAKPLRPVLYARYGKGKKKHIKALTLPRIEGRGQIECLVPLPDNLVSLRLDPFSFANASFRLDRAAWLPGSALVGRQFVPTAAGAAFVGEVPPEADGLPGTPASVDLTVAPIQHLATMAGGWFEATGVDPQFAVQSAEALPTGWTWVELEIADLDSPLDPVLYACSEGDVITIEMGRMERAGVLRRLIRLPDSVDWLRFDPTAIANTRFRLVALRAGAVPPTDRVYLPSTAPLDGVNRVLPNEDGGAASKRLHLAPAEHLNADGDGMFRMARAQASLAVIDGLAAARGLLRMVVRLDQSTRALGAVLEASVAGSGETLAYPLGTISPNSSSEYYLYLPEGVGDLRLRLEGDLAVCFSSPIIELTSVAAEETAQYTLSQVLPVAGASAKAGTPATLQAAYHLEDLGGERYRSTGNDPQFGVSLAGGSMPAGWNILSVGIQVANEIVRPILYIWQGDQVVPLVLPPMGSGCRQTLVHLPAGITAMRLDPTDRAGVTFAQPRLDFLPLEAAAGSLLTKQAASGRDLEYTAWCEAHDTLTSQDEALIRQSIERMAARPLISVLMPVYNPEPRFLERALDTVLSQLYPNWELCIADDCSTDPAIREVLERYSARDPRIKVVYRDENGHISRSSNSAMALLTGEFTALMDHDDELAPHALYMVAHEINSYPKVDVIYSDEDKVDSIGRRHDPHFKTDWNQELFYSQNMVAHLGVYRTSILREIGGFRAGFEGSQDYDFTLRFLQHTTPDRIRHIPHVLYHWRIFEGVRTFSSNNPSRSIETARRALTEYFDEVEPTSELEAIEAFPSWWRIRRTLPDTLPLVTIIIPTRDRLNLVRNCVDGILNRTAYDPLEVIIVDNGSQEPATLSYFADIQNDPRVRVLRDDGPFNYSRLNNLAIAHARGTYVCFLNNDIEVIEPDWLSEMVSQALQPQVGAVGAKLLYADGSLQHAGVTLGVYGVAAHGHRHFAGNSIGYFGHPQLVREASAVTAAALLMPKDLFETVGGFDAENLVVSYNDVDLCLRIGEAGYRIVYTPFATLFHLESASRGPDVRPEQKELQRVERGYMLARWEEKLRSDPFYNPNLSVMNEDYGLAFPPRARRPWIEEADIAERLARRGKAALPAIPDAALRALAEDTAVVIASMAPHDVLFALSQSFRSGMMPAAVWLVDNTARSDAFHGRGRLDAVRAAWPDLVVHVLDDPSQDFDPCRTANLGIGALHESLGGAQTPAHVVLITEDASFASDWFASLLRSWISTDDAAAAISPRVLVRENVPQNGLYTDGFIEEPVDLVERSADLVRAMSDGFPVTPGRIDPAMVPGRSADTVTLLPSGVVMMRRDRITSLVQDSGYLLNPVLRTLAAATVDLSHRLQAGGITIRAAVAPLVILAAPRVQDITRRWQAWHDYLTINRAAHGGLRTDVIEFICPFHRGDVLIGLQVAYTAYRRGIKLRFHVAESLLRWVKEFEPPFPVEPLPVPVPPATETALYLLRAHEYVVSRPDASARIASSHPARGLDAMNGNLVPSMLGALGLTPTMPLDNFAPQPDEAQTQSVADMLAPFGDRVILLHKAGGWGLKSLPDHVLKSFAAAVKAAGFILVQIGGPDDTPSAHVDGTILRNLSVGEWVGLFRAASAVAGIDSWTSHMAAIADVPQITFYGSTHPQHVASKPFFREVHAPALLFAPTVACSPCNSLSCLYQPERFCPGYAFDAVQLAAFLDSL